MIGRSNASRCFLIVGAALFLPAILRAQPNATVSVVKSRAVLGANDLLDWASLGENGSTPKNPFTTFSQNGVIVTGADTAGFELLVQCPGDPCGWNGNFATGDTALWVYGGALTLSFSTPVSGGGVQIQSNPNSSGGNFTATVNAFNGSVLLGTFTVTGDSNGDADNSAIFIGVKSAAANITKLVFVTANPPGTPPDFAVNQLSLISSPAQSHGISLVAQRTALGANDLLDWADVGVSNGPQAPGGGIEAANPFTAFTRSGSVSVTGSGLAGVFEILTQCPASPCGWQGNFAPGDGVLWSLQNSPMILSFSAPVQGAGFQIQSNPNTSPGAFTAVVQVFGGAALLATFSVGGSSDSNADNSAVFVGVKSATFNITSVVIRTVNPPGTPPDFAVNNMSVISPPISSQSGVSVITDSSRLAATDYLDWSTLGPVGYHTASTFAAYSHSGALLVMGELPNPQYGFELLKECPADSCSLNGDFNPGDNLLWDESTSMTLSFGSPITAAGFQIQSNPNELHSGDVSPPPFLVTVQVFDGTTLLAHFTLGGNSNQNEDGSGYFLGVRSNAVNITSISVAVTSLSNMQPTDFMINRLLLSAVTTSTMVQIQQILPNHGGNAGTVTMQILGSGFQAGAVVRLTGSGRDIVGANTTVANASALTTTFDLSGAAPGVRTVVLANPDGTSVSLPNGFTVEEGGAPVISVDIIGRDQIRTESAQTYYLAVTNIGSVDSGGGILSLTVPSEVQAAPMSGPDLFIAGSTSGIFSGTSAESSAAAVASAAASSGANTYSLLFATPGVPAGQTQYAPVQLFDVSTSDFTVTSQYQQDQYPPNYDDYLAEHGVGYHNVEFAGQQCTQCSYQALDLADDAAGESYSKLQLAWTDVIQAFVDVPVAIGKSIVQSEFVEALGLKFFGSLAVNLLIDQAKECMSSDLTEAAGQGCLLTLKETCVEAAKGVGDLLEGGLSKGTRDALESELTTLDASVDAINELGDFDDAVGAEKAALGKFQQEFAEYINAYTAYGRCLATQCGITPPQQVPPTSPGTASLTLSPVSSLDPNDKVGTRGAGAGQYLTGGTTLKYAVEFGNESSAKVPAQAVVIADPLSVSTDDVATFSFGPIAFGDHFLIPPPGASYSTTVDLRPQNDLLVAVAANVDVNSGQVSWTFTSLDPATGKPPTDPNAGFLPPGGSGSVFFTVLPRGGLATNTQINNQASIVFDRNAAIPTPAWTNIIDNAPPMSDVLPLPATESQPKFLVGWTGSDVGSGVASFTIYASDNGRAFTPWLSNTAATQATYPGAVGHTYGFYSIATDLVGNVEPGKTSAEATTEVTGTSTCTYTFSATSEKFGSAAGVCSIKVLTQTGCAWTAASQSPWITVVNGASGSGSGSIEFDVAANTGSARTGTIDIAGQTVTVMQAGTGGQDGTPRGLQQVSVAADGTVAGIDAYGQIYMYNPQTQTFQSLPGALAQIAAGPNGAAWGINTIGQIWRWDPTQQTWINVPGALTSVSVGADGDVWGVNAAHSVYHYVGGNAVWVNVPGSLTQIAVGYDGSVWGIGAQGAVYRYNVGTESLVPVGGTALTQISIGGDGVVWGLNGGASYRFNPMSQQFERIAGPVLAQIVAGSATNVWALDTSGRIYSFDSQTQAWVNIPGTLAQILAAGDGAAWGVDASHAIYQLAQTQTTTGIFHAVSGPAMAQIAATADGNAWGIDRNGNLQGYNAATQAWTQFNAGTTFSRVSASFGQAVTALDTNGGIYSYNPATQTFMQMPGQLQQSGINAMGALWGVNAIGGIYQCAPPSQNFSQIPGMLANVSVGVDGSVWGLNGAGSIYRYNPQTVWDNVPGALASISVGSASVVWGLNATGSIYRYDPQSIWQWDYVPGALTQISAGFDGAVWGINAAGSMYRYDPVTVWDNFAGTFSQVSVSAQNVVWAIDASGAVWRFF